MIICSFDIETIPNQNLPEGVTPEFDETSVLTGNAGPAKAQEKIDKVRAEFDAKLPKKMSVDPTLCQIVVFAGILYDTEKDNIVKECVKIDDTMDDEYSVVLDGWDFIKNAYMERIPLVTYNGRGFDLQVMLHRAMQLDIPLSPKMFSILTARWGGPAHYDLMEVLAGYDKTRWHSLDFYLRRFRLATKGDGMDGSQVYPAWQAGEFLRILKYGKEDAIANCLLFERIEPWILIEKPELVVASKPSSDEGQTTVPF